MIKSKQKKFNSTNLVSFLCKLLVIFSLFASAIAQDFMIPSHRSYTSRTAAIDPDLIKANQQIHKSQKLAFSWTWCSEDSALQENLKDQSLVNPHCLHQSPIQYGDSLSSLRFAPILEQEYRQFKNSADEVLSTNIGGLIQGHIEELNFWVDARMYSEKHEKIGGVARSDLSWDREFIDVQDADGSGSNNLSFVSFARYRANMTYHSRVGKFGFRREIVHWGPGQFLNLSFHHDAVPFNHVFYQGEIGPVRVWTLWGRLLRSEDGQYQQGRDHKSIYAHRYEWSVIQNLSLGMTEQLILFNQEEPWAFVPIVPLFMEKGQGVEEDNNGNMAFDITYRLPDWGLIYSEFLLDDLQEPSTLFDDFWGNRWAWMAGLHFSPKVLPQAGLVAEYSRVEPWVYTHNLTLTAQSSNGGSTLGNPNGPNSQAIVLYPYYQVGHHWSLGAKAGWIWKGTDAGSSLKDGRKTRYDAEAAGLIAKDKKVFIKGVSPDFSIGPVFRYRGFGIQFALEAHFGDAETELLTRIAYQY